MNGQFNGVGSLTLSNKEKYQGGFLCGQPHGTGYLILSSHHHKKGHTSKTMEKCFSGNGTIVFMLIRNEIFLYLKIHNMLFDSY